MLRRYSENPFSILNLLHDIVVGVLALRFLSSFVGASTQYAVVSFINYISQPLAEPFRDTFQSSVLSGYMIEWYTLAAIVSYMMLTFILMRFLALLTQIVDDDDARVYHRPRSHRHRHA